MELTQTLTNEYRQLWKSCAVRQPRLATADSIVDQIVKNKQRYTAAGKPHGVPWYVVGIIHVLEGSGNFATHLHNGDPLTARTVQVPAGRPTQGQPPFTWEESASDALVSDGLNKWKDWSLSGTLFVFERFNGFGYRNKGIQSPYLWSFSNHYTKGKFVKDGVFSATAVSEQCGAAVLLFRMISRGLTKVTGVTSNGQATQPTDDAILRQGAKGPAVKTLKAELKKWFDITSPGEWETLKVAADDVFGGQLKKAVKAFQSRVGLLDDGEVGNDTRDALAAKPKPTKPTPPTDDGILRQGAKGPAVKALKAALKKWFDANSPGEWETLKVAADDVFGGQLKKAVKTFQARAGLLDDGEVGNDTRDALAAKPTKLAPTEVKHVAFPGVLKRGATGESVRLLQCWLSLHECRVAVDSGYFAATEKAVRKFQTKRRLPVTGIVDPTTWEALIQPMVAALTPIAKRDALGKLVVAYARQHLKQHPREIGGENSGPWVRLYTDNREGKDFPWCAGFATFCLKQACATLGVAMPVRQTLGCDEMATTAGGRFVDGDSPGAISQLKPGSYFLKRAKPGAGFKYAHTGIIVSTAPETMETIEGNTNDEGSSEGIEVCARTRGYVEMDFIVI